MAGYLKKLVSRVAKGQGGFTLIEMIVVVGIIAVLAAVIVPNIGKFIGTGESGAKDAESESVQTAMNAMMAEGATEKVKAHDLTTDVAIRGWSAQPEAHATDLGAVPLAAYLQKSSTTYYYCWNESGQLVIPATESRLAVESALACS